MMIRGFSEEEQEQLKEYLHRLVENLITFQNPGDE
jgi:CRISPR/Cas system type I-B associated protein Csh2 (Cas7 group RAMP superfamily)